MIREENSAEDESKGKG